MTTARLAVLRAADEGRGGALHRGGGLDMFAAGGRATFSGQRLGEVLGRTLE